MTTAEFVDWAVFWTVVAIALVADIIVARLRGRTPTVRNAALWSGVWIGLGLLFGVFAAVRLGGDAGISYLTAYLLEESLSVDNLFLFVLIFAQTGIPTPLQHRALFWGVVSAFIMRAMLIGLGLFLLQRFHWVIYPFAGLLVFAAARMLFGKEEEKRLVESSCALCTSWVGRFIPIEPFTTGTSFLVRDGGRLMATPLLVALVVIETTDLVFALDSIPAVFAVTRDPFLVYTSNVFALLGLRSLYFVLAGAIRDLRFLQTSLGVLLLFVAAKMLLADVVEISPLVSLAVVAGIFGVGIVASRLFPGAARGATSQATVACTHRDQIRDLKPETTECAECVRLGDRWVELRMCLSCGNVACCDSSKNRHATKHFDATGHPIMRSIEAGENWKWCYVDRVMVD
jgi:tellurite resistance protein TerC